MVRQVVDKRSSDNQSDRDTEEEAHPHVPLIHHGVAGKAMVVRILTAHKGEQQERQQIQNWTH